MMPAADTAIWLIVSAQLTSITLMLALKGNATNRASELASYFLNKMGKKKIYCQHHPSLLQIYMPWCHLFISKVTWESTHFYFVSDVASLDLRWIFIWFILLDLMFSLICERADKSWKALASVNGCALIASLCLRLETINFKRMTWKWIATSKNHRVSQSVALYQI